MGSCDAALGAALAPGVAMEKSSGCDAVGGEWAFTTYGGPGGARGAAASPVSAARPGNHALARAGCGLR